MIDPCPKYLCLTAVGTLAVSTAGCKEHVLWATAFDHILDGATGFLRPSETRHLRRVQLGQAVMPECPLRRPIPEWVLSSWPLTWNPPEGSFERKPVSRDTEMSGSVATWTGGSWVTWVTFSRSRSSALLPFLFVGVPYYTTLQNKRLQ